MMSEWSGAIKASSVQVSKTMRRGQTGYFHWCPSCEEAHPLPDKWSFNGNLDLPTFSPSFKHNPTDNHGTCHYNITDGKIQFHGDSWHHRTDLIPMPELPEELRDEGFGK